MSLLVEIVEIVAVGKALLEVMVVAEELFVGGEDEMELGAVEGQFVEHLLLEIGELGEVGGGELVLLAGNVVFLLAHHLGQRLRRLYGGVYNNGVYGVFCGAVDGKETAQGCAHHHANALGAHQRVELFLHGGGIFVVESRREHLALGEHFL